MSEDPGRRVYVSRRRALALAGSTAVSGWLTNPAEAAVARAGRGLGHEQHLPRVIELLYRPPLAIDGFARPAVESRRRIDQLLRAAGSRERRAAQRGSALLVPWRQASHRDLLLRAGALLAQVPAHRSELTGLADLMAQVVLPDELSAEHHGSAWLRAAEILHSESARGLPEGAFS